MTESTLPVGDIVEPSTQGGLPRRIDYVGRFITLSPVNPQADVEQLFAGTHGSALKEQVWTYMGYGPFESEGHMLGWLKESAESDDPLFFAVHDHVTRRRVGMASFLNIANDMRRLELGHIWYALDAQGTQANTEAAYL